MSIILPYYLKPLHIGRRDDDTGDFYPFFRSRGHIRQLELMQQMDEEYTTVSLIDIMAVTYLQTSVIGKHLAAGRKVTTALGTFSPTGVGRIGLDIATGREIGEAGIEITFSASPELVEILKQTLKEREPRGPSDRPEPRFVADYTTMTYNKWMTPGGSGYVKGDYLRFDADDPRQGVFIIELGRDDVEMRAELDGKVSPTKILIKFPEGLQSGNRYVVEVRVLHVYRDGDEVLRTERAPFKLKVPTS